MSSSSRLYGEIETTKVDLPVFVTPNELVFASNKRRSLLTLFNPYGHEAQFRIMATNPDRFEVSVTRGTLKPNRRIEITIRLLSHKIDELPEPKEEQQTIDFFRVTLSVGQLRGYKPVKVHWCQSAESLDVEESGHVHLLPGEDRTSKLKIKSMKSPASLASQPSSHPNSSTSPTSVGQRTFSNQRSSLARPNRLATQIDNPQAGSNVNLVCTICALACVITLFLPLAIDSELCKKAKSSPDETTLKSSGLLSQLTALLSVSYEMKLGCSFALGLFTYRLISTLPD